MTAGLYVSSGFKLLMRVFRRLYRLITSEIERIRIDLAGIRAARQRQPMLVAGIFVYLVIAASIFLFIVTPSWSLPNSDDSPTRAKPPEVEVAVIPLASVITPTDTYSPSPEPSATPAETPTPSDTPHVPVNRGIPIAHLYATDTRPYPQTI